MQVLPVEISDSTYRLWEQLSPNDKQLLETRLKRALRAFLFQKNSAVVQQAMAGKGPYQSEDELTDVQWLSAQAQNPAFDFLHDEAEAIYSATDGTPFQA